MRRLFLIGILGACCAVMAWGAEYRPLGAVSDYAGVLSEKERLTLEVLLGELRTQYQVELAILTLPNLNGQEVSSLAREVYRDWGLGRDSANQAALLLLNTGQGEIHLYVGMGLRGILTGKWGDSFSDALAGTVEMGDYSRAVVTAATGMTKRIYAQAAELPQRNQRLSSRWRSSPTLPGGSSTNIAILGAVLMGGLLLFSTMMGAGRHTSIYEVGRDFERNRSGAFGNKKPHYSKT